MQLLTTLLFVTLDNDDKKQSVLSLDLTRPPRLYLCTVSRHNTCLDSQVENRKLPDCTLHEKSLLCHGQIFLAYNPSKIANTYILKEMDE